jgi:hypothetical protein
LKFRKKTSKIDVLKNGTPAIKKLPANWRTVKGQ